MKFIKTRNEFLNEAVRVETNRYERSHGKKPRGYGQWAFYFDDKGGEPIFTPKAMSYSDAVKWAKGEAKKAGKEYIYVGESLNEGYSDEERMELAKKGLALDDGSFPIKDLADLKNAIQAYGRAKDQAKAAKFISKRAKALGAEDLIPDTEDFQKSLKESLDGSEVFQILDAAAMFTDDAHVAANQMWKDRKDLIDYLLSDHIPKKYHKQFLKYVKEDESTVLEGKLTYSNVNMYGSEIKTIEDLVSILNTFDNYAEMSDDSKKGDKMYSAVRMIKQFADKNKIKLSKLQNKLNDKGQTALKRYF